MSTVPPSLQPIIGAGLLGILLSAPLFGIYSVQSYHYFMKYPKDEIWMKFLVYFLWVALAVQYAFNIHSIYAYVIQDFGHPQLLSEPRADFITFAVIDSVCAVFVQGFFAWRLYIFIKHPILKWICAIPIVALSWLGLVSGLLLYSKGISLSLFSQLVSLTWLTDLWLGANVACDVVITFSMCITLHRSRTGIKKTDRLINKLIAYSIQTGAVTSFVEIFCLITATTTGFHFGHILVIYPLAGLYCISFLANLHARAPNATITDDGIHSISFNSNSTRVTGVDISSERKPMSFPFSAPGYEMNDVATNRSDDLETNRTGH